MTHFSSNQRLRTSRDDSNFEELELSDEEEDEAESSSSQKEGKEEENQDAEEDDLLFSCPSPVPTASDNFIFCDECNEWVEEACLDHSPLFVEDGASEDGAPDAVRVAREAVFAACFIPAGSHFGPIQGQVVQDFPAQSIKELSYLWELKHFNGYSGYVLGTKAHGNAHWMSNIREAETRQDQNLVGVQYHGQVYYKTLVPVALDVELKVCFGEGLPWSRDTSLESLMALDNGSHCERCELCPGRIVGGLSAPGVGHLSQQYLAHLRTRHRPADDVRCRQCSFIAGSSKVLRKHINRCHSTSVASIRVRCPICSEGFQSRKELGGHVRDFHDIVASSDLICEICGRTLASRRGLVAHRKTVHRPLATAGGNSTKELQLSQRTHSAVDGVTCAVCGKILSSKGSLQSHMKRMHFSALGSVSKVAKSKKMTSQCRFCYMTLASSGSRSRHEARKHADQIHELRELELKQQDSGRNFLCDRCPKRFSSNAGLRYHVMRHSGSYPHTCRLCGKGYPTASEVRKHFRRTHKTFQ